MKCPLIMAARASQFFTRKSPETDCIREECAWYDETVECCALVALVRVKTATGAVLGRIADNLPERS